MVFLGIYRAIYDYAPQSEGELAIKEGDLLFVIEKGDDDWWKAKKKAQSEEEEEPEGLIPNNYIEEVSEPQNQRKCGSTRSDTLCPAVQRYSYTSSEYMGSLFTWLSTRSAWLTYCFVSGDASIQSESAV